MATSEEASGVDIYLGSGGAPEGVLAAAALRCIGGQMQGRLIFAMTTSEAVPNVAASRISTGNTTCSISPVGMSCLPPLG